MSPETVLNSEMGYEQVDQIEEVSGEAQRMVDQGWPAIEAVAKEMYRGAKDDLASSWVFEFNGDLKNSPGEIGDSGGEPWRPLKAPV